MSNPTSVINFADSVAQFLARTNQFGESNQDLIQQKFNKKQATGATSPVFAALESRSRSLAQWANMMDDFVLQFFTDQLASAGGGWQEVFRIDFRDVFAAQGAVDLNSLGTTVVIDGVTWETPTVARNGQNMVLANTSFGITANGLEVVDANNNRLNPGTVTGHALFASLFDIAKNTKTPFEADPTRNYLFQIYVSSQANIGERDNSGVFIFRDDFGSGIGDNLGGDQALYISRLGTFGGFIDTIEGTGGTGVSPPSFIYNAADFTPPLPFTNVPTLWYSSPQSMNMGGAAWDDGNDDFPDQSDLQMFVTARDSTDVENDIVFHPRNGFFCGMGHAGESGADTYDAVIQQFRILQR